MYRKNFGLIITIILMIFLFVNCDDKKPKTSDMPSEKNRETEDIYAHDFNSILGKDKTRHFDSLSPADAKKYIIEIFDKIDENHNSLVDLKELSEWIKNIQENILMDDVNDKWNKNIENGKDMLDFDRYLKNNYAHIEPEVHSKFISDSQRKWEAADLNADFLLNKTEFFRFVFPEYFPDLKPLIAQEILEHMDKNNDSFVDIDEYLEDQFPAGTEVKEEWLHHERQNFGHDRDMNKDGFMDRDEIQQWLMPYNYDRAEEEARHIIGLVDDDQDGFLSKYEVEKRYEVFGGSRKRMSPEEIWNKNHEDL